MAKSNHDEKAVDAGQVHGTSIQKAILVDAELAATPGRDADVASQFLASLDPSITDVPVSEAEARKLLWKIDLGLLPLIAISVILSAVDKGVISNAALYGLKKDAHLTTSQFSWAGSIFFFGYLFSEWPMAWLIQRLPVGKVFGFTVMGWAIIALCTAAVHNFAGIVSLRFIMGGLESIVFPTCSLVTVMWYKKSEQPLRTALWFNTFSTIFTGVVSYGIGQTHTRIAQWRLLYLVLGAATFLWSVVLIIFMPDSPVKCWWLSDREKYICILRVKENNTGVEDKKIKWYQVREALLDAKTWLIVLFAVAQNIPNGAISTFSAFIVSGQGYTNLETVLIGIPTGVLSTAVQVLLSFPASKLKNMRCTTIALANLIPLVCAILLWKLPRSNHSGLLGSYYGFWVWFSCYVLSCSLPMANTSGHSKKITVNALMFIGYSLGNIIGPQVFRASDAPEYRKAFTGLLCCIILATAAITAYGVLCWLENKKRDKEHTPEGELVEEEAFSDKTDKEKRNFRYTY